MPAPSSKRLTLAIMAIRKSLPDYANSEAHLDEQFSQSMMDFNADTSRAATKDFLIDALIPNGWFNLLDSAWHWNALDASELVGPVV